VATVLTGEVGLHAERIAAHEALFICP